MTTKRRLDKYGREVLTRDELTQRYGEQWVDALDRKTYELIDDYDGQELWEKTAWHEDDHIKMVCYQASGKTRTAMECGDLSDLDWTEDQILLEAN